jgi:bacterioferritin (cytochrome b1)
MEKIPDMDYRVAIASGGMVSGPELGYPESPEISSEVERLMNEFEAHENGEREFVQAYREIAEKTKNPLIRFLLRLIISDEEKHHAVTHAMASTLKGDLTWTKPEAAIRGLADLRQEQGELLKLTEGFIKLEKQGMKEYKKLIKASEGYYGGLFVLLLRSMIHDSEKHVEILEFLRRRLKGA